MVRFRHRGNFNKTEKFFKGAKDKKYLQVMEKYGVEGIRALSQATPIDTGRTASLWDYEIHHSSGAHKIVWTNSNINGSVTIAIILQYGHGTGTGGYVQGRDYINPAMRPIFDKIANDVWKEVTNL